MTDLDRCITCKTIRQDHTPGEDTVSGWMCEGCVRRMDGHKGVLHSELMRFLLG